MKVLVNSWRDLAHPNAGGSEFVVDQLASSLSGRGHDVVVRCGGPLANHDNYRATSGGGTYSQYLLSPWHQYRDHRDRDIVVDVVNGMGFYSPVFTRLPTVAMIHHIHTDQWPLYYPKLVASAGSAQERHLMPWAYRHSLIIATSPSTKHGLVDMGVHPDRIRQLPINCALAPTTATKSTTPTFVACGRVTAHKRIDLLLRLWERVRPVTGGRFIIIGDGPEMETLRAQAGDGVEFAGRVTDEEKARLLTEAWVLVHGAAWEGWGLVVTEAGLARTPSIGFNARGIRDAILDETSGLLADDDDQFVQHWIALATDTVRRTTFGNAAHDYATKLSAVDRNEMFASVLGEAIQLHQARKTRTPLHHFPSGTTIDLREGVPSSGLDGPVRTPALSIIIPAYNEGQRISRLLNNLPSHIDQSSTEVIVVDDGSSDDTVAIAEGAMTALSQGSVLSLPANRGKGGALRAGVAAARGSRIVFMDADQATDLADLPALISALDDAHIAIGSRTATDATVHNGALHRRIMAQGFNLLVRNLTSVSVQDSQCGFKAFRGPVARLLFHLSEIDGFAQDVELLDLAAQLDFSVAEIPVKWTAIAGSKVSPVADSARMARDVGRHRIRPINAGILTGLSIPANHRSTAVAAKEIAGCLRATDPVLHVGDHVHVLLPGVDLQDVPLMAERIANSVGYDHVSSWTLDARSLLRRDDEQMGAALRRIGEPFV